VEFDLSRGLGERAGNITALSGLGDIARQRHQNATAAAYYDQILKQDRNHVPTLMSRGDMYWEAGNKILAVALYRRALGQVGSNDPVGQRALRRIEEFDRDVASGEAKAPPSHTGSDSPAPSPPPTVSEPIEPNPPEPIEPLEPSAPPSTGNGSAPSEGSPPKALAPGRAAPSPGGPSGSSEEAPADKP
jgi:tetratricopeptide (TPR) repeat protein